MTGFRDSFHIFRIVEIILTYSHIPINNIQVIINIYYFFKMDMIT